MQIADVVDPRTFLWKSMTADIMNCVSSANLGWSVDFGRLVCRNQSLGLSVVVWAVWGVATSQCISDLTIVKECEYIDVGNM